MKRKVSFEILKAEEIKFGKNNFIEISRKKAITKEGENEFISLSRGFFLPNGEKRFKTSVTIPLSFEIVEFITAKLREML